MPSRRAILAAAGASAFGTLAGCGGRDASEETATNPTTAANETSTTTAPADHEPFPPDATSFEADLVRGVTVDHPPRFAATLTNEGNKAFTVMCGFAPPFSVTTLDAVDGDASLFCYPVAPEARQHVRAVARFGENATDTPDLPPESRADECWRVTGSYATDDVAYARTLAAGESLASPTTSTRTATGRASRTATTARRAARRRSWGRARTGPRRSGRTA
ncbi:hypothetical protein J2754_002461 [Halarchaeum solikamskense]|uniref:hypothetical protein n=1 Tax=Halarchaeum nitratireducens TaxID=489913 RepID=UPI001B3A8622|nr:hypothetical protein [Halarchaeum solikamskense]MBP2252120.1 hypothetical protein [Halarchaeum solikamskense]